MRHTTEFNAMQSIYYLLNFIWPGNVSNTDGLQRIIFKSRYEYAKNSFSRGH